MMLGILNFNLASLNPCYEYLLGLVLFVNVEFKRNLISFTFFRCLYQFQTLISALIWK